MNSSRREFLKYGMLTVGATTAAGAGVAALRLNDETTDAKAATPVDAAAGSNPTAALTSDGKVVHICDGKVVHRSLPVLSNAAVRTGVPGRKWIMVIDLAKCDGCKQCTAACSRGHFTPPDREWIRVFQMQDSHATAPYWFPKPCFHCDNPPCTRVCPVDATFKRQDGIVLIDNQRCIGCRFCMAACPYSTRFFNWGQPQEPPEATASAYSPEHGYPRRVGTVEKCDFCPEMLSNGQLPCCATACGMGAIYFGDQNEDAVTNSRGETERLSRLLADRAGYRYLEELGTEPRVFYLPPKNRLYPVPRRAAKEHGHG